MEAAAGGLGSGGGGGVGRRASRGGDAGELRSQERNLSSPSPLQVVPSHSARAKVSVSPTAGRHRPIGTGRRYRGEGAGSCAVASQALLKNPTPFTRIKCMDLTPLPFLNPVRRSGGKSASRNTGGPTSDLRPSDLGPSTISHRPSTNRPARRPSDRPERQPLSTGNGEPGT